MLEHDLGSVLRNKNVERKEGVLQEWEAFWVLGRKGNCREKKRMELRMCWVYREEKNT